MRLLWLVDVLRGEGLTVHEYPGWQTRGSDTWGPIVGVICHATAGSRTSTDEAETRVLWVTGSTSAPAPVAQLYLSRSGQWWVGASGRCNHVRLSDVRASSPLGQVGNSQLVGVEAANDNRGEPWPPVMLRSYARGVAAICRHLGWLSWRAQAHWEHQSGKTDPAGIDMAGFRGNVTRVLAGEDLDMEQTDPLLRNPGKKVADFLYDVHQLRGWFINPPGAAVVGAPPPGSVGAILVDAALRPAPTPEPSLPVDVAALAEALRPHLEAAAEAAVRRVLGAVDEQS